MDYMDIDQVLDVPDTPDRLAAQNTNGRGCIGKEKNSSAVGHSGNTDIFDEGVRNRPRDRSKLVIGNGRSRSLTFRPSKNLSISEKSKYDSNSMVSGLGNSSSFENPHLFRRMTGDKTTKHEKKHSAHSQHMEKGKASFTSQSSPCQEDNTVVDLTEQNRNARVFDKAFLCGALGNSQTEKMREGSITTNGSSSSLCSMENSLKPLGNSCKGKEKVEDKRKGGSGLGRGKGIDFFGDCQPKAGMTMSTSLNSITSPRVTGQKRLVRNGCISPHNIAKAKQLAEKHDHSSMGVPGAAASNGPPHVIDINDFIAEDNSHRVKGKGIVVNPFSSKEPETKTAHLSSRDSIIHCEKANRTNDAGRDAFRCFEGLGGWRSTRNRTKKMNLPLSDEGSHLSRREDDPGFVNQHHESMIERRENGNGNSNRTSGDCPNDQDAVSCQLAYASPLAQTASHGISQLGQSDERRHAAITFIKRQKQGSTSSNHGDCSTSGYDDSEILFLGSSGEPSNSRSTRNQSRHGVGILNQVIEIDEFSPGIRNRGSRNIGCSSNDDSDARARQVEADEMLAHELQEQLYNEVPGVGVDEIDAHIALSLQQEENSQHAVPSGSRRVFRPRGSLNSNLHQQPRVQSRVQSRVRSSQNSPIWRGTQSRVPTSTRMARLRGRFPGQPRTLSSSETLFPPSMDMDMRIHILEALEAFSDMGVAGSFLQVQRDFNENDYEMLLALDENNHHVGTSLDQINRLPLSTVQTENLDEACAICLETPTNGDTMRHLPCLHKFHKDCIDPWLQRRTSCPVCKSSIT